MMITIDNPQLVKALESQADGLGIPAGVLAESALAAHMGFPQMARQVTGAAIPPEYQPDTNYPVIHNIPRAAA
jgi:hypothetical protein